MKKLLSILAISGIVGSSSSVVVACDDGSTPREKQDISAEKFNKVIATTGADAYKGIRTQIGSWAKPGISADEVKADKNIGISLWKDGASIKEESATVAEGTYQVRINVGSPDVYFTEMEAKSFDVEISASSKIDLTAYTFSNAMAGKADVVYNNIRTQIADLAGITAADIKTGSESDKVYISLWDGANMISDNDTTDVAGGKTYDVHIEVTAASEHYRELSWTTTQITVDASKVGISELSFDGGISWNNTEKDSDIYTDVRTQIAKEAGIQERDIATGMEKDNVLISLSYNGKALSDDSALLDLNDSAAKNAKTTLDENIDITLTIKDSSIYFNKLDKKSFTDQINVKKVDITTTPTNLKGKTSAKDAYNQLRLAAAKLVGVDPSVIQNGSEESTVLFSLFDNKGNWISPTSTASIGNKSDKVTVKVLVSGSKLFEDTSGWQIKEITLS